MLLGQLFPPRRLWAGPGDLTCPFLPVKAWTRFRSRLLAWRELEGVCHHRLTQPWVGCGRPAGHRRPSGSARDRTHRRPLSPTRAVSAVTPGEICAQTVLHSSRITKAFPSLGKHFTCHPRCCQRHRWVGILLCVAPARGYVEPGGPSWRSGPRPGPAVESQHQAEGTAPWRQVGVGWGQ